MLTASAMAIATSDFALTERSQFDDHVCFISLLGVSVCDAVVWEFWSEEKG
jgi:hypothetical protein